MVPEFCSCDGVSWGGSGREVVRLAAVVGIRGAAGAAAGADGPFSESFRRLRAEKKNRNFLIAN